MVMTENTPKHVAIIPDGNRRWARLRGKRAFYGHSRGVAAFEKVAMHAFDCGVECLSMWGMSLDNLQKRSKAEVFGLLRIFKNEFRGLAESEEIHRREIKINVLGRWREKFPAAVKAEIERAMETTKKYRSGQLNFFLVYNGTDEMRRAVRGVADSIKKGGKVTDKMIKNHLMTRGLPRVDLVIRTGGEPHLSNGFMMWDVANAELYFTDKLWPAFTTSDFDDAMNSYRSRRRKLGS